MTPAPAATEIVTRPEPGLARGKWEAPRGVFFGVIGLVLLLAVFAALGRLGLLRLPRANPSGTKPK